MTIFTVCCVCYIPRACKLLLVALSEKLNISPSWAWREASGPQSGVRVSSPGPLRASAPEGTGNEDCAATAWGSVYWEDMTGRAQSWPLRGWGDVPQGDSAGAPLQRGCWEKARCTPSPRLTGPLVRVLLPGSPLNHLLKGPTYQLSCAIL